MMKRTAILVLAGLLVMLCSVTAFAGQWKQDAKGWWWDNGNGTFPKNTWQWCDGNNDGTSECYYFDANGYCLLNTTTPDGYKVDANGAWVENGVVKTQHAAAQTAGVQTAAAAETEEDRALKAFVANNITGTIESPLDDVSVRYENKVIYLDLVMKTVKSTDALYPSTKKYAERQFSDTSIAQKIADEASKCVGHPVQVVYSVLTADGVAMVQKILTGRL